VSFEALSHAGFGPLLSALLAGYALWGLDGRLYLTHAGETYLASCDAA